MKINGKVKLAIAALVLAGCAFGGYRYYEAQQAAQQAAAVETTKVVRMDMKSTVSATGTIQPVDSVEVSSKITARLKSVLVKENDKVTAGQTVATLDAKDYEPSAIRRSTRSRTRRPSTSASATSTASAPIRRSSLRTRR